MGFQESAMVVLGGTTVLTTLYVLYTLFFKIKGIFNDRSNSRHNLIPVITDLNPSLIKAITDATNGSISSKTFMEFIKYYNNTDPSKDITVVIHTHGGSLSSGEAIVNLILNHNQNEKNKINAFIPYMSYSCGCFIALCSSNIYMHKNAVVGPCDAQMPVDKQTYSSSSIIKTVSYKMEHNEKISEVWLASANEAKICANRQKEFITKLVERGHFNKELGQKIYEEFFSGKHNHDKVFSAQELKDFGLNITIVDEIPSHIKSLIPDS
jgi:ClpP class serine protease